MSKLLALLQSVDEANMPLSAKMIRESLLSGNYPGRHISNDLFEAGLELTDINVTKEKDGEGVSVKVNGHEYRYAPDENSKYDTAQKLADAFKKLIKVQGPGKALRWIDQNGILYYGSKKQAKAAAGGVKEEAPVKESAAVASEVLSPDVLKELYRHIKEFTGTTDASKIKLMANQLVDEFGIKNDDEYYDVSLKDMLKFFGVK